MKYKRKEHGGMKKQVKILIKIFLFVILYTGFLCYNESQKEYINGNVLNLPLFNQALAGDKKEMESPWKTQYINSMFMYRSLFLPNSTLDNVSTDLAKSYDISDDGIIYTIVLNEDDYWSDGMPVVPEDVLFTIKAVLKMFDINQMYEDILQYIVGATAYRNGETDEITGVTIEGNVITIELIKPYNTFLPILSQIVIAPEHILRDEYLGTLYEHEFWNNPVVCGMYRVDELVLSETESYFKLVHNEYYKKERSDIEEVRLHIGGSQKILDYAATNNTRTMTTYNNSSYYKGYNVEMFLYRFFVFNIQGDDGNYNEAVDDIRIRQAIIASLDREALLSYVYMNVGEVSNSGITTSNSAHNGFVHEYDVERAKDLLTESGYDLERTFVIAYTNNDPQNITLLTRVSGYLEEIGLKVELSYLSTEEEIYVDREYDMLLSDFMAFNETAWYDQYHETSLAYHKLYYIDDSFEGLFRGLREAEIDEKRVLYLEHLQKLEQEKLYILPMFLLNQVVYIQEQRVSIPDNIEFGNPWFRYDIKLADWAIRKE